MADIFVTEGDAKLKYDILGDYRAYLLKSLRPATARLYAETMARLLDGQNPLSNHPVWNMDSIMEKLESIKYKNELSQAKNALLYFCKFQNITLPSEYLKKIDELEKTVHRKYRNQKKMDFREVDKKIKHIRNKKLKLSYQVLVQTGLRVSELAQVKKDHCTLSEQEITLFFIGKGGRKEQTSITKVENEKLFEEVKSWIEITKPDKTLFYSAIYLQKKAKELGFACHDLRRACAKMEYKKTKSKKAVMHKLRHKRMKTTNIYLKSKLKI